MITHLEYTSRSSGSFQSAVITVKNFKNLFLIDTLKVTGGERTPDEEFADCRQTRMKSSLVYSFLFIF